MQEQQPQLDAIVSTAEDVLSKRLGGVQKLKEVTRLSGSGTAVVARAKVAPSPFLQARSVVIKHVPETGELIDASMFLREVIAYQFTTSLNADVRPGPVLLAYDVDARIIVISDSGDGDTFAELLSTSKEALRMEILRNLGESLGKMHAGTATKEQHFDILLRRMLQKHPEIQQMHRFREHLLGLSIEVGMKIVAQAGIPVPEIVAEMAAESKRRLLRGQHRAFTPFDLSPDNIIVSESTHFLDYEWAGFRDVTFDIACVIAGFPQYLSSRPISDDEADTLIDAWVDEVGDLWPNVRNHQRLQARILIALVGWAFSSLAMMHIGSMTTAFADLYQLAQLEGLEAVDADTVLGMLEQHHFNILQEAMEGHEDYDLIRQDLYETFESVQRFAQRNADYRFPVVGEFAGAVVEALRVDRRG
ncbi:phosphotransferase [Corynebacterium pseudopelargi]|uniref:Phosphotransferase enzyme family protein n=1 Tax=Corynebacterium pseudopelargi TaxID=2080757 RepID=A0A3G6ITU5_9CORY|nr:phosphotransferase [Corynebacterium pseudopelargi]AZA09171.1 Phosphotransferase enzyme family protein [Corynebacterium pseudopelargi]